VSERVCPCSLSPVLAPVALPFLASPRGLAWQSPDSPPRRRTTPPPFTCSRKPAEPCRCTSRCAAGLELVGGSGQGVCRGDTSSAEAVAFGGGALGPSAPRPGRPSLAPPLHTHTVWPDVTVWGSPGAWRDACWSPRPGAAWVPEGRRNGFPRRALTHSPRAPLSLLPASLLLLRRAPPWRPEESPTCPSLCAEDVT
jgi:hypothetical protein